MVKAIRKASAVAVATMALSGGIAVLGGAVAFADTTLSPGATVDGVNGSPCFQVVAANATFNPNGTPKSVSGGSVTFNQPVLSCV
ncbi:MAG: hypothetical protein M3O32_01930 [Actinomycetota bacterium]|nr:hypothetical protein [Actinomycetota bacterium]